MHKRGLEHESQVYINGRPADFRCQGVFIEFDGMNREDSYFEEKFGDEPYVVVRDYHELDRDLGFLLQEEMLRAGGVVTFEPVVSITPTKNVMMYDIIMEEDPHNFLADGVVVHNTAWFKFHFPVEFLTCALSTVDADRIPDFITESRRMGYKIYPPDINLSRVGFTPGQEDIRYGLDAVKGIGVPVAQEIVALQPFSDLDDFVTRAVESKETKVNRGALATLVAVGAFDTMVPNRRGLELSLEHVSSGASKRCVFKDDAARGPGGLPCRFDWDTEPNPPMITKGRGLNKTTEPKPPPKKCSVSCRNYTAPPPVTIDHIDPYTSTDISQRESELLGVWLTHSPFDRVDPTDLEMVASFEDVETGGRGEYVVIAVVSEAKRKFDKNGNEYAFVSLQTPDGVIDTICFNSVYESIRPDLVVGALVSCIVNKNDRGVSLSALVPTL
jgi:DNA polymerase-3 subunit alpha